MGNKLRKEEVNELNNLEEKLVKLSRVAKVVKGGRRFSFSALMVVGDKNGHIGIGFGKANEIPEAIRKGVDDAKKNIIKVPLTKKGTIPHNIIGIFGSAEVLMKPASAGTGIIAGGAVRFVIEYAGIHDILCKSVGCDNALNIAKATYQGLASLKNLGKEAEKRGKATVKEVFQ